MENLSKLILATPAGSEINVRTTGNILEKKTVFTPCRANQRSALSRSFLCMRIYFPYFSTIHLPPLLPIRKSVIEPTRLANVAVQTTPHKENLPDVARNPENGTTTSEGIGIAALSSADKIKIPDSYPSLLYHL